MGGKHWNLRWRRPHPGPHGALAYDASVLPPVSGQELPASACDTQPMGGGGVQQAGASSLTSHLANSDLKLNTVSDLDLTIR